MPKVEYEECGCGRRAVRQCIALWIISLMLSVLIVGGFWLMLVNELAAPIP